MMSVLYIRKLWSKEAEFWIFNAVCGLSHACMQSSESYAARACVRMLGLQVLCMLQTICNRPSLQKDHTFHEPGSPMCLSCSEWCRVSHLSPFLLACSTPPVNMKVQPVNKTALLVTWNQPEIIYHPPIVNYMISYSWTKNEDEKEKTFTKDSDKDLVKLQHQLLPLVLSNSFTVSFSVGRGRVGGCWLQE